MTNFQKKQTFALATFPVHNRKNKRLRGMNGLKQKKNNIYAYKTTKNT